MKNFKLYLLTALVIFALLFAACDDDGDMEQPTTPAGQETTIDTVTEPVTGTPTEPVTEAHVHVYGEWEITMLPTCTEDGSQERVCACGEKDIKVIPAKGHTETIMPTIEPTCTGAGLTEGKKCKVCGAVLTEQQVIPALGHTEQMIPGKAATCIDIGLTESMKCTVCGAVLTEPQVVPAFGHTEHVIPGKAATCTDTGLTDGKKCTVCGVVLTEQQVIPAFGHTEQVTSGKAASCTDTGLTEGMKCTICGVVLTEQQVIPAFGHTEQVIPGKAATCTDTGLTEGMKCTVCGAVLTKQQVIPALGHTEHVVPGKAATCTDTGLTDGKECTVCGVVLENQNPIPAKGHIPSDWITDKYATFTAEGSKHKECTVCGTILETGTLPVIICTHAYNAGNITAPADCTHTGVISYTCSLCGNTKAEVIPATGHTDGEWITDREANCTEDGNKHQVCAVCKATIQTETIPHVGHDNVLGKCPKCNCILEEYNSLFVFEIISDYHSFCYDDNQKLTIGTYYIKAFLSNDYYETLAIPSEYNGIPVTAINSSLLSNKNVECLIIPDTITCVGTNLCGSSCSCPLLKRIICLPKQPFTLGSYALDPSQLAGGCKIYVPSSSESLYKESHSIYSNLITSIDELDESLINKIKFRYGL